MGPGCDSNVRLSSQRLDCLGPTDPIAADPAAAALLARSTLCTDHAVRRGADRTRLAGPRAGTNARADADPAAGTHPNAGTSSHRTGTKTDRATRTRDTPAADETHGTRDTEMIAAA
ncbi:hypothetical protein LRC484719_26940 [Mycobacterium riyadhense]